MKCFYHKTDLDGKCSGAVVKCQYPECEMIPIDYGQKVESLKYIKDETVYMVDFTLEPFSRMIDLAERTNFVWIDHHRTAIEEAKKRSFNPSGVRDHNFAACELTWKYCFPDHDVPLGVTLLGRYDVWDHDWRKEEWGPVNGVLLFQYGMRLEDGNPESSIWDDVFVDRIDFVDRIIERGRIVYQYVQQENEKYVNGFSFVTTFEDYTCICCNKGVANSKLFDSVWNEKEHDLMMTFCRANNEFWLVTLYAIDDRIDCGIIAKKYGGGGHRGAAGFRCKNLPFEI